jgi:hypothetical protein
VIRAFSDLEPEHRLLFLCARPRAGDDVRAEIAELLTAVDWEVVVETAEAHGITALVLQRLDALGLDIPPEIAAAGRAYLARQAARNGELTGALQRVVAATATSPARSGRFT